MIPFFEKDIKNYLDRCIRHWRERLKEQEEKKDSKYDDSILFASYYIDAFQSIRVSLFGEFLEKDNGEFMEIFKNDEENEIIKHVLHSFIKPEYLYKETGTTKKESVKKNNLKLVVDNTKKRG